MPILPKTPELEAQLAVLMNQALDDQESGDDRRHHILDPVNLNDLQTAMGVTRLFRILITNACSFTCDYCPMRAGRKYKRLYVPPERLARVFMYAVRRGWAKGLFVTSGIPKNPVWATDRMIELVETVREKYGFPGYIHAKALPGAEPAQLDRLAELCDRLSFNLEAACQGALDKIAPQKSLAAGMETLVRAGVRRAEALASVPASRKSGAPAPRVALRSGMTTQFVVTPDGADDRTLLNFTGDLYARNLLHHAHFAAFRPIHDTPMENQPETPVERERRLYEADYLLRQYGFTPGELPYDQSGRLPLGLDVKLAWALERPSGFPIELLTASREQLLRVPGIGPRGADRLIALRRDNPPRDAKDLARLGFALKRCIPFVTLRGKRLGASRLQLPLFAGAEITPKAVFYQVSPGTFR